MNGNGFNNNYNQPVNSGMNNGYMQYMNNNNNQNEQPKSKKTLILIIAIIVVLICLGLLVYFVFFNKPNNEITYYDYGEENTSQEVFSMSKSTETDNIAFSLMSLDETYVIKFKGSGYGEKLELSNGVLTNGKINIIKVVDNINYANDNYYVLSNFMDINETFISIVQHKDKYLKGSLTEYITTNTYSTLDNKDNYYLVENKVRTPEETTYKYEIYILIDSYDILIRFSENDLDKIKKVYDYISNNTETCIATYYAEGNDTTVVASKNIDDHYKDEHIDISKWTFAIDLIQDYYIRNGLILNSSASILLVDANSEELLYEISMELNNLPYYLTLDIDINSNFDDIKSTLNEKLGLSKYSESYIKTDDNKITVYLVTKSGKEIIIDVRNEDNCSRDDVIKLIRKGL